MRPIKNDHVTLWARIDEKSIPEPNSGCTIWTAALTNKGYGKIGIRNKMGQKKTILAHRLVYELVHGIIPDGMVVMHQCDIPACVNVDHLKIGTQADNLADMWTKGRARPGWIPSDGRSNCKLNWESVRLIRASTESAKALARKLGVSDVLIGRVRNGIGWRETL